MNANTLCSLIAQRIDPAQFQLWGSEVHWMKPEYATPENKAIVADVIANYDTLAAEYEAEQRAAKEAAAVKAKLAEIDAKSIRSIREWIAAQPNASQFTKDYEAQAVTERTKLK